MINEKNISEIEISVHNLKMAHQIAEDMNKKNSVLLFAVSMDKSNELNVVAGIPDTLTVQIMEELIKGIKNGIKVKMLQ